MPNQRPAEWIVIPPTATEAPYDPSPDAISGQAMRDALRSCVTPRDESRYESPRAGSVPPDHDVPMNPRIKYEVWYRERNLTSGRFSTWTQYRTNPTLESATQNAHNIRDSGRAVGREVVVYIATTVYVRVPEEGVRRE